jgi:two-component system chemotaxis response regulator CheB
MTKLQALVVDDTSLYRHILEGVINALPGISVTGLAPNGQEALTLLRRKHFDVVFLDVEMPIKNGLETMKAIRRQHANLPVIMVSGTNRHTTDITIRALEAGAYDFIPKPEGSNPEASRQALTEQLLPIVRSLTWQQKQLQAGAKQKPSPLIPLSMASARPTAMAQATVSPQAKAEAMGGVATPAKAHTARLTPQVAAPSRPQPVSPQAALPNPKPEGLKVDQRQFLVNFRPKLLVIGVSTGGPAALIQVIPQLSPKLNVPVLIVQHMPAKFTASLAENLNGKSQLTVVEASDGDPLLPNHVYIAPGGYHLEIAPTQNKSQPWVASVTNSPAVNSCKPSVDVLFNSVSQHVGRSGVLAVILTGMGKDGTEGVACLKQRNIAYCLSQQADTCVVYGMPKAIDEAGLSDESIPLNGMAQRINYLVCR